MALFKKTKAGGFMDVIRCDEPSYLIWKWHPTGSEAMNNNRENAIRLGSSLRVKDGEAAVFVYKKNGVMEDFILGPYDEIISTKNLPILASIIGLAYEGDTPFQAEVYFINLAKVIQTPFAVPFFDMFDSRFPDFGVPTAVRGKLTFNIADPREFVKYHRLMEFDLDTFEGQIKDAVAGYVKSAMIALPEKKNIPVVQIEREIESIRELVGENIQTRFKEDFGVNVTGIDISTIEIDKTSEGYQQLRSVTTDVTMATVQAEAAANIKTIQDMQRINMENTRETLRMQREEAQYAQHMQTQTANIGAFQIEKQAEVGVAGANALGQMGKNGATDVSVGGGTGMNMAGLAAGMAMGGAVGQNMAGMLNNIMGGMQQNPAAQTPVQNAGQTTPPPIPVIAYFVALNGQQAGPFDLATLAKMAADGSLTASSLVWKQGMESWSEAGSVAGLQSMFETK